MRLTGEPRPIVRANVPPPAPFVDPRIDEEEISWDPAGADVPVWAIGAYLAGVGVVLLMVASLLLAAQPANQPEPSGRVATPTTYGPPVGW